MNKEAFGRFLDGCTVLESSDGGPVIAFKRGDTVPTDGTAGYAVGCIFGKSDGGEGTALYVNEGTTSSCDFNALSSISAAQEALLGATAGTVTASKAVIVDANKDAGDFRNLDAVNIDAGSSGVAGSVDVFASTASKGKFTLTCTDQDGDTVVTLKPAAMGQATVVSIPDPGAATANVLLTSAANDGSVVTATAAELNQLDGNILADMTAGGAGFEGVAGVLAHSVVKSGAIYKTEILMDLTGLDSSSTDGDIIGDDDTGAAYFAQITAAVNGTIVAGRVTCLEVPGGGDDDIAIYSATENTGVEDSAIGDLTETLLLDHGAWSAGEIDELVAAPAANEYLYLVAKGADTAATYTGGIFLIELWGV